MPTASKQNSAAEYAKNHWRRFESNAEHDERVEAADAEAGRYFDDATKVQKAAYTLAISDLRGLSGPRYERARADARAAWDASTEQARELFYITADEIMRDGEVSEETGALWDALSVAGVEAREAARTATKTIHYEEGPAAVEALAKNGRTPGSYHHVNGRAEFVDRAAAADDAADYRRDVMRGAA